MVCRSTERALPAAVVALVGAKAIGRESHPRQPAQDADLSDATLTARQDGRPPWCPPSAMPGMPPAAPRRITSTTRRSVTRRRGLRPRGATVEDRLGCLPKCALPSAQRNGRSEHGQSKLEVVTWASMNIGCRCEPVIVHGECALLSWGRLTPGENRCARSPWLQQPPLPSSFPEAPMPTCFPQQQIR
jgi:hypothetical protein